RRDSITEEITITTTTTNSNSKLLTIVEHSNISISTSLSSSIQQTSAAVAATTTTTPTAPTTTTTASSVAATQVTAAVLQRRESVSSNHSNGSNNVAAAATNSNNLGSSNNINTVSAQPTPSINIVHSESKGDQQQPLQSQSVDSNGSGAAQAASSCTDSPSSRKSSTSSKGKPAKLSTSSSGRDEDTQSKLSEPGAITESHFVRGEQHVSSSSTSNEKPAKGTSRLSERAKKKSWYNVIYPNYKSRAEDFKKLFKEVPNDERLIVDYSCALQRDILVQGRLYVSQNYVCFHANIFTWETYVSIKWKDVTAITKEKTALVIPNAISISTAKEKFFFATFASRDKSFLMLFRVWQNTLMNKQFSPQEIWRYVHNCYGEELGLTTDDEDYIDPTLDAVDNETDLEFQTAIDDLGGEQSNSNQTSSQPQQSGNSSASSGGGNASTTRKSKTKYFFNSSKSSNLNSSANASASGSDNKASDTTRKSNKKMKANAKELTLSSVKAAEQTVAVTLSVPASSSSSNNSSSTGNNGTTSTTAATTTTTTTTTASGGVVGAGSGGAAATDHRKTSDKVGSHASAATVSESNHGGDGKRKVTKNQRQRDVEMASKNDEAGPTDVSDSSDSEENSVPFVPSTECTSTHEGRQIVHTILHIRVDTLFNFLFSKSKFLTDFHESRKSTDLIVGEWQKNEEGQNVRLVNVTVQLAASVGPKTSKVTEYQTMRECSKPGELYSIDVNSVNAGIPYADSFSVLIHFCLARTVDDHTMLSIHAQIKYKKSIWGVVKGFIEKNTWAGLEDFFCAQLHALQSETCIPPAKGKGRRPRRGLNQLQLATSATTTTATTTTTTTASSTDNDNSRRSTCHHSHQHHRPHRHHNHHHHHHHRHHHHSQHNQPVHQTSPRAQDHHQQEEKSTHPHPHQHQSDHPHSNHSEQQVQQHPQQQQHSSTATQARPSEEANSGQSQVGKAETLEKWDSKLLSAGGTQVAGHHLAAGIGAAGGNIGGVGVGGAAGSSRQQQQQQLAAQQQQQLLLAAGGQQLGQMQDKFRYKGLSLFVILLMCLLLALNVILLLKLWKLEEHIDVDLSRRARMPSLAALKELPNTNQDWLELLRQQELSHESELRKWHQVLQTAIELLKKVSIVCEKIYNDGQLRQSIESMHTEF
ncbi:hypothetical protein KR044_007336, partial [Drosophila immigrans]